MLILEDLWGSKVQPHEKGFPNKQYARAMQQLADCSDKLISILNDEQNKLFAEYVDDQLEFSVIAGCLSFVDGFQLGAKIMLDVLTEGGIKDV